MIHRSVVTKQSCRLRRAATNPNPYATLGAEAVDTPAHRALALDAARQGLVLLKNEGGALPLAAGKVTYDVTRAVTRAVTCDVTRVVTTQAR